MKKRHAGRQERRGVGRQGRRHLRKMKNTKEHKEGKRDSVKKDIDDNGRRGRAMDA